MINLGDYNTLKVVKSVDFGLYLDGGDDAGEILLPNRYVSEGTTVGDELEVFIYLDQEERLIATTERPLAKVGDFAWLEVSWINQYGAFLNWGLMKDLFCPFREQKMRMQKGQSYLVYVTIDEESYRLMATAKIDKYLSPLTVSIAPANPAESEDPVTAKSYSHGTQVDLLVWQKTDLGFKVIVDNRYQGLLYENQIFQPIRSGMRLQGYIDHIRQDGKSYIILQPTGQQHTEEFAAVLLQYLKDNGGHCDLGDKSPSKIIQARFKVSKKTFKRAIGDLYRQRLITLDDNGIHLL